jgi:hypothetical protein
MPFIPPSQHESLKPSGILLAMEVVHNGRQQELMRSGATIWGAAGELEFDVWISLVERRSWSVLRSQLKK